MSKLEVSEGTPSMVPLTIQRNLFGFIPSFAVRAACQLKIFDIVGAGDASSTFTTEEIAAQLPSKTVATQPLYRLLRMLAQMGHLTATSSTIESEETETRFGRTLLSDAFRVDVDDSVADLLLMLMDESFQKPWHYISDCILTGKSPAEHAYGSDIFTFARENPKANSLFQRAMTSATQGFADGIIEYEGFRNIKKLVDVGGGSGILASKIVAAHPHVQVVTFDLPHVVALNPKYPGVESIVGNMFESVPTGDAVILKHILHDWVDEDCVTILKNVHKALTDEGRVLIVELVLEDNITDDEITARLSMDLLMLAHTYGMERTSKQWHKLLECSGFTTIKVVSVPNVSIIEAFKNPR